MRRFVEFIVLCIIMLLISCSRERRDCEIRLSFSSEYRALEWKKFTDSVLSKGLAAEVPDTNNFILSITNTISGSVIYRGKYSEKPEKISVTEGSYTISVISEEFSTPAFNAPQWGDLQVILLKGGESVNISLLCKQLNSGLRINYSDEFKAKFATSLIHLHSGGDSILYSYDEKRIAYFTPSRVETRISSGVGERKLLFARTLRPAEILSVNLSISNDDHIGKQGIFITVDTSRVWINEDIIAGNEKDGSSKEKALTVSEAKGWSGAKGVWVKGYIVGGDITSSEILFTPNFTSRTHFAISDKSPETLRANCMAVELKTGKLRDSLNLVDNKALWGKMIWLQGDIVDSYFGLPGLKNIKAVSKK